MFVYLFEQNWKQTCKFFHVFEVSNTLAAGFLEKVYQRALLTELRLRNIRATAEASFAVTYKGHPVGESFADILVEDVLVIELKCAERLSNGKHRLVSERFASLGPDPVSCQSPETQSRMEATRPRVSGSRAG